MAARMIQRLRGLEVEVLEKKEDQLSRLDPSLMTERQQLTFLLRTTSHEASEVTKEKAKDAAVQSLCPRKKHRRMSLKRKKRPSAVDLKQQRMAQEDELRYEEPVEVSGSDYYVWRWNEGAPSFENREPRCALCCDYETAYEASFSDVLFLCPSCDQKYPTQWALGRRVCTT